MTFIKPWRFLICCTYSFDNCIPIQKGLSRIQNSLAYIQLFKREDEIQNEDITLHKTVNKDLTGYTM